MQSNINIVRRVNRAEYMLKKIESQRAEVHQLYFDKRELEESGAAVGQSSTGFTIMSFSILGETQGSSSFFFRHGYSYTILILQRQKNRLSMEVRQKSEVHSTESKSLQNSLV
jgi:hypothetical protein